MDTGECLLEFRRNIKDYTEIKNTLICYPSLTKQTYDECVPEANIPSCSVLIPQPSFDAASSRVTSNLRNGPVTLVGFSHVDNIGCF